ncbi:MAG: TrkA C-terminal domain-containing protein [Saprospiraceae bacterium]|nr:TrkA C-terminal domain-containing protein [Saprospiraceae bacterium]
MIQILAEYPLLLLFIVAALGYMIGTISIKGVSLGVSAILFTGLAFGAIDPQLKIPEIIFQLGLSIFIYSVGLTSGPAFFESYRKNGMRDIVFIFSMLILSGLMAVGLFYLAGFSPATITGIYTGSTTNTAALAGVLDYMGITFSGAESIMHEQEAVIGYSLSYPMGVLSGIIGILLMERLMKIDYRKEAQELSDKYPLGKDLVSQSIEITNPEVAGRQLRDIKRTHAWNVVFGRIFKDGQAMLTNWDTVLDLGDMIVAVGSRKTIDEITERLGQKSDSPQRFDRTKFDASRLFVSNPDLAGMTLSSLNLHEKYNAIVTRIRRGDIDMIAQSDTILELGDRVRFIARRSDLKELAKLFGDSYHASSKVNLFSFGLGIGLGLILGSIEISLGGGVSFKLGYAGGPLIVGLILGSLRRTGRILWTLPYSANITLQQIGLILLLSTIGVRSGDAFFQSLSWDGVEIFLGGLAISLTSALLLLYVGYKWIKIPFSILSGFVSNQPAILDVAMSRSKNRLPVVGFTMMMPLALISKIIIAQMLFVLLVFN